MVMKASQMRDTANTAAQKTKGRAKEGIDQLRTAAGAEARNRGPNGVAAAVSGGFWACLGCFGARGELFRHQLQLAEGERHESLAVGAFGTGQRPRDTPLAWLWIAIDLVFLGQITWTVDTGKGMADALRQACHAKVASALQGLRESYVKGKTQAATAVENAKAKASAAQVKAKEVVQDKHVQATAAGVLGGAATLGASGGATGLAAGAAAGAAIGVVPAIFTFGLSIPVGAAIGGGAGLAVGASVGALSGAAAGGAAGYQAYAKREQTLDT